MTDRDEGYRTGYLDGLRAAMDVAEGLKGQMPLARADRFADVLVMRLGGKIEVITTGSDLIRGTSTHLGG